MTTPQDPEKTTNSYTTMRDLATNSEATAPDSISTTPVEIESKPINETVKEEGPGGSGDGSEPTHAIRGFRWFLVCLSLYISALIYGLDTTIAADVQSSIVETFGHIDQLAWIGAGFPLGSVAVVLPIGVLFTRFNMKLLYISSLVLFEVGSAVCGAAPNMNAIIVGRVIAGAGGAGLFLGCLNYFSAMTVPAERGLYIASIGLYWGGGTVLGPIIGGAFSVSSATWRWAFYINLVIAAVTAPVYLFFLPSLRPVQGQSLLQRIADLDIVGFILSAAMWTSFAMVATMAGGQWPWDDGRTIALWAVFGVLLISYIIQQWLCIFTTPQISKLPCAFIGVTYTASPRHHHRREFGSLLLHHLLYPLVLPVCAWRWRPYCCCSPSTVHYPQCLYKPSCRSFPSTYSVLYADVRLQWCAVNFG